MTDKYMCVWSIFIVLSGLSRFYCLWNLDKSGDGRVCRMQNFLEFFFLFCRGGGNLYVLAVFSVIILHIQKSI